MLGISDLPHPVFAVVLTLSFFWLLATRALVLLASSNYLIAGILASLLGVGGGMIKGPVLLELGMSADVTAATSSYMIVSHFHFHFNRQHVAFPHSTRFSAPYTY